MTLPLALYIHIPYCVRKCPYCDFNSHEHAGPLPEAAYVDTLLADLRQQLALHPTTQPVSSIFIGGGTPSLFSATAIGNILEGARRELVFDPDIEITLEANPGTLEGVDRLEGFIKAGVNRLSLGIQSFSEQKLHALGRIHSADEARRAVALAKKACFERINLDLMFALPGQTLNEAMDDLDQATAAETDHLSWYQLTLEPNTVFSRHPPAVPDDDLAADIAEAGIERLGKAGFSRYEISAYATSPSARSRHNLNYWQFGDYIGIGAGAHGKRTTAHGVLRTRVTRAPADYLRSPRQIVLPVEQRDLPMEFMMNALRLPGGFETSRFGTATGLTLDTIWPTVERAQTRGLLDVSADRIRPTPLGLQYLNELLLMFDPDVIATDR